MIATHEDEYRLTDLSQSPKYERLNLSRSFGALGNVVRSSIVERRALKPRALLDRYRLQRLVSAMLPSPGWLVATVSTVDYQVFAAGVLAMNSLDSEPPSPLMKPRRSKT
jgi:hypothetical protein